LRVRYLCQFVRRVVLAVGLDDSRVPVVAQLLSGFPGRLRGGLCEEPIAPQ
jgi:hypothetical protein